MIKKYGLKFTLKQLNIIEFVIAALIILIAFKPTVYLVDKLLDRASANDTWINMMAFALLIVTWLCLFFRNVRNKKYKLISNGRNLRKDMNRFNRGYHELCEFYKKSDPHRLDKYTFDEIKDPLQHTGIKFGFFENRLIAMQPNGEGNIGVLGSPGKGKTTSMAITNCLTFGGSCLVVDIKADIFNFVSTHSDRKIIRFCPDSPNFKSISAHFDPFYGLEHMTPVDRERYLTSLANILIPDPPDGGEAAVYYASRARKMLIGVIYLYAERYKGWDKLRFPEIIHAILGGNLDLWIERAKISKDPKARERLLSFEGNSTSNTSSAYENITNTLQYLADDVLDILLDKGGTQLSVNLMDQGYDIYLQIRQENLTDYSTVFNLIIQTISRQLAARQDKAFGVTNRQILMVLDELHLLKFPYDLLQTNMATLRSKSVNIMILTQNLSQLYKAYTPHGAHAILGSCHYLAVLETSDVETHRYFSELFGKRKVLTSVTSKSSTGSSTTSSRSCQEGLEEVLRPEDFGDINYFDNASTEIDFNNLVALYFDGKYCLPKKINCYNLSFPK